MQEKYAGPASLAKDQRKQKQADLLLGRIFNTGVYRTRGTGHNDPL
jgi:hypothetical protein